MSDRVLLLKDGMIIQEGSPIDMYARPNSRYTAEFMGMNNVVAGEIGLDAQGAATIRGKEWSLDGVVCGTHSLAPGQPAVAVIRMERVRLASSPGPNRLRMHLDAAIYLGDRWEYRLARGDLQLRAQGEQPVMEGDVWCECPKDAVWLFPADA